jgi:arginine/lysine/ornithine decarboxylase
MATSDASSEAARNQIRDFKEVVATIVAELRSEEIRDTYAAITLTEVLNQQLASLTGTSRIPSRKQRLKKNYEAFNASLEAIKSTSPDAFRTPDKDNDVNTPR